MIDKIIYVADQGIRWIQAIVVMCIAGTIWTVLWLVGNGVDKIRGKKC